MSNSKQIYDALHIIDAHYRQLLTEQLIIEEEASKLVKEGGSDPRLIDITKRHFVLMAELYPIMFFAKEVSKQADGWLKLYDERMKRAQDLGAVKKCENEAKDCTNMQCMHQLSKLND